LIDRCTCGVIQTFRDLIWFEQGHNEEK
jgi:hypothetical protein